MNILSKFPERLKDLMVERNLTASALANNIGVKNAAITRYLSGTRLPNFNTLIALVEYFNCSADFLLGISDYSKQDNAKFEKVPKWATQFKDALRKCGYSQYYVQNQTKISWGAINAWINGKCLPYPDSLVKIAKAIDCSVDFLIGREK